MERVREAIAADRAHTDKSLGEERANTDSGPDLTSPVAQRAIDDLIEHDRIIADERLWKFRDRADSLRERTRFASPAKSTSVVLERYVADRETMSERAVTDGLVAKERNKADAAIEKERAAHESDKARMEARRHATDDQLSMERYDTDGAVAQLSDSKKALSDLNDGSASGRDVLAMVSHDLRSPLAIIAMSAQLITERAKDGDVLEIVQEVTRATARMERLLADLLDVARIDSGTLRVIKREHELGAFLAEVHQSYLPLFADRGIAFTTQLPATALVAWFDHDRLVQVLSNLLGNALKFTPKNGSVSLSVERRDGEIEFAVHNTGEGIKPEELPNVFKRFWQLDRNTRRGLGLGLHICQEIVVGHGGRVWIESEPGKGATARFTVPVR